MDVTQCCEGLLQGFCFGTGVGKFHLHHPSSAKSVLLTFLETNCLTEVLYPEAIERATYLDDYLARTGKTIGPLHGLPISLKDCFITAPHPSSNGLAAYANEAMDKDSLLVTILRDLGAVFYVKTNVPV